MSFENRALVQGHAGQMLDQSSAGTNSEICVTLEEEFKTIVFTG